MIVGAAACLLLLVAALAASGLGTVVGARLLLNAGTADLNRATLSETIGDKERRTAVGRAVDRLRLAGSLDPNDAAIQRNLALALAANDESREARAAADRAKALTLSPDRPANRADVFQLGRTYAGIGQWGEAVHAWQAAGAGPQLIQLGNRMIRVRNFDQAIDAFIATARVDPTSQSAYDGVTRAARDGKASVDETIAALGPLLEVGTPTEFGARLQAARVLREAGQLQDAAQYLARAEEISAPPELSFEYGRLWMAAGLPKWAVPLLVRPVADLPYEPESYLWLARAQAQLGQHEEAVATIRQGLSKVDTSGQFAPPAERLPETAAVRAVEIRRSERALLLGVLGESLIRLGRTDEALPALDEATDALPKDNWLAATRAEALAVKSGASPNLLFNPTFDRDGAWAIRDQEGVSRAFWAIPMFLNEAPEIAEGRARLAPAVPAAPESRLLAQDVFGLEAGHRYRLTVRVRAEGLGDGAVMVVMTTAAAIKDAQWTTQTDDAADWTTLKLETEPGSDLPHGLTIGIGFAPGTRQGAVLWCEEATLVEVRTSR